MTFDLRHQVFSSLSRYQRAYLRPDLVAGVTVWAVMVPEALAYASIAGVPAVVGLYAAVPALLLYAAFGSSRHLIVGPMSATAALSAAIVADFAGGQPDHFIAITAALALVTGMIGILAGLARLGFVAAFISEPVLKGFIVGLALTIIVGQIPALFGIDKGEGNFFEKTWSIVEHLGDTHWRTAAIGFVSLALVLVLRRWLPLVPGALVVVLGSVLAVSLLDLDRRGVDIVGAIDPGLPELGLPDGLSGADYLDLVGPAVGVLLIGFAEGLGAAKTYAAKSGYTVDANRELTGLGAANLGSGLCAGMVVNGSLSKTAVNGGAGAKTQLSGLTVAVLTLVTLLFLTGLFEKLPEATLAAVVIAAVIDLVDIPALVNLYRVYTARLGRIYGHATRIDFLAAVAAMVGVLVFDTLPGLVIGVAVSLLLLLYRVSRPHVASLVKQNTRWVDRANHPDLDAIAGVLVVRVEAGLFFANADHVRDHITSLLTPETTLVVLDAETSPFIDVSAVRMLLELHHTLRSRHVGLRIARDAAQFGDVMAAVDPDRRIGLYPSVTAAIDQPDRRDDH